MGDVYTDDSPSSSRQSKRAARFGGDVPQEAPKGKGKKTKQKKGGKKMTIGVMEDDEPDWHWAPQRAGKAPVKIVGTSKKLEKSYFRLVDAPDPSDVRPKHVLAQALRWVRGRLASGEVDYHYACDQYKAMRQDAQVQGLRDETAVAIYETHARAAIDHGDLGEFNQCQTQLAELYAEGSPGSEAEFTAYRILYGALQRDREAYSLLR